MILNLYLFAIAILKIAEAIHWGLFYVDYFMMLWQILMNDLLFHHWPNCLGNVRCELVMYETRLFQVYGQIRRGI